MDFWQKWSSRIKRIPLWTVGAGIGVLFLIVGFAEGQFTDIYRKAVMICLECIGIG
ncbi:MAG: hypothetical protein IJ282_10090 [Lachnospiraceae bacterium]|nr:hypothetical protein [Lachnospiraceae bacterium]